MKKLILLFTYFCVNTMFSQEVVSEQKSAIEVKTDSIVSQELLSEQKSAIGVKTDSIVSRDLLSEQKEIIEEVKTDSIISQDNERKHAVGVGLGLGLGIDYSYKLNKTLSITARYSLLKYSREFITDKIGGNDMAINAKLDFGHADVLLSIGGVVRFVVGAAYFTDNQIDTDLTYKDDISLGGVTFKSDDIGELNIKAKWARLLPYIGIGVGRAVPKKGFGFGLELGTYYASKGPTVTLDATGLIEDTKDQEGLLQDALKENKFLPNLNLRFAYSF